MKWQAAGCALEGETRCLAEKLSSDRILGLQKLANHKSHVVCEDTRLTLPGLFLGAHNKQGEVQCKQSSLWETGIPVS